jgi:hypothetical protein
VPWIVKKGSGKEEAKPEEESSRIGKLRTLAPPEKGRRGESQGFGEISGVSTDHDRFYRGIHERARPSGQGDSRILRKQPPEGLGSRTEKAPREGYLALVLVHLDDLCNSPLSHRPDVPIGGRSGVHRSNHGGRGKGPEEIVQVRGGPLAACRSEVGVHDHYGCRWCCRDALKQVLPTL